MTSGAASRPASAVAAGETTRRPHRCQLAKLTATAPGHVAELRRLVFDPLSRTQVRHLNEIATRVGEVVQPDGCLPRLPGLDTH